MTANKWTVALEKEVTELQWQGTDFQLLASCDADWDGAESGKIWRFEGRTVSESKEAGADAIRLIKDQYSCDTVVLTREVRSLSVNPSWLELRLIVSNSGSTPLRLRSLTPLLIEGPQGLQLGNSSAADWIFYRSGRQKNDLPSVCVLGRTDEAYMDALVGLSETGKYSAAAAADGPSLEIVSDELSVLVGGAEKESASLLIGFTQGLRQLSECRIRLDKSRQALERLETISFWDGVAVEPGEAKEGEWLRLDTAPPFEAVEQYVEAKKQASGTTAAALPPSVFCTWYYYGDTVSQDDIYVNLEALKRRNFPIDVVQIDEGWEQRFGNWDANHRFPDGMKQVAHHIQEAGYRPGIWTAPFLVEPRSDMRFYHDDWLLRDKNGDPVLFYMNNTDNMVWDVTHPGVQQWIEDLYKKLTEWGYTYHKLDFTRAVALNEEVRYHNPQFTRAEAYRMGIEAVRRGIGKDGYLLICGGLFSPPSGLADAHRTSSDVLSMWSEWKGKQGGKVAPFTIKQNVLRYWMNDLWHNDPDALMVRRQDTKFRSLDLSLGLLTDDEAKVTALNQYWGGGLVCFTEPMAEIDDERLGLLRHLVPSIGKAAVPRDMYEGKQYSNVFDVAIDRRSCGLGEWHTVSVVNWEDGAAQTTVRLDEALVGGFAKQHQSYTVAEFGSGRVWNGVTYGDTLDLGELPPHAAHHLKITPETEERPILVSTDGHFSMGATEITELRYDNEHMDVSLNWPWSYPLHLVLKVPMGTVWEEGSTPEVCWKQEHDRLLITLREAFTGSLNIAARRTE